MVRRLCEPKQTYREDDDVASPKAYNSSSHVNTAHEHVRRVACVTVAVAGVWKTQRGGLVNMGRRHASTLLLLTLVAVPLSACGNRESTAPAITGPALIFFYTDP